MNYNFYIRVLKDNKNLGKKFRISWDVFLQTGLQYNVGNKLELMKKINSLFLQLAFPKLFP